MKRLIPPTFHRPHPGSRSWRATGATRIDLRDERGDEPRGHEGHQDPAGDVAALIAQVTSAI